MADPNPASLRRKALGLRAVLALGGLVVTTDAAQDPYKREPPVDRTTPILERMTPAQREHAKLHASHRARNSAARSHGVAIGT